MLSASKSALDVSVYLINHSLHMKRSNLLPSFRLKKIGRISCYLDDESLEKLFCERLKRKSSCLKKSELRIQQVVVCNSAYDSRQVTVIIGGFTNPNLSPHLTQPCFLFQGTASSVLLSQLPLSNIIMLSFARKASVPLGAQLASRNVATSIVRPALSSSQRFLRPQRRHYSNDLSSAAAEKV